MSHCPSVTFACFPRKLTSFHNFQKISPLQHVHLRLFKKTTIAHSKQCNEQVRNHKWDGQRWPLVCKDFLPWNLEGWIFFTIFVVQLEMHYDWRLRLNIARASSALHSPCTSIASEKNEEWGRLRGGELRSGWGGRRNEITGRRRNWALSDDKSTDHPEPSQNASKTRELN